MAEPTTIPGLLEKWRATLYPGLDFATMLAISVFVSDLEQLAKDSEPPDGDRVALRDVKLRRGTP